MIKDKILTIRGFQVILDEDLAKLYEVETKQINRAIKRNIERFPSNFMFQLNKNEFLNLRYHFGTTNKDWSKKRFLPYVFTEQGVAMLSSVLKSKKAIEVSIKIINAFVAMRKFINNNNKIFSKLESFDKFKISSNEKFEEIFNYMSLNKPKQGIFYQGQIFNAYKFVKDLIKTAKNEIILIDNYVDYTTLDLFSDTKAKVKIYTKKIPVLDLQKYNEQYNNVKIINFTKSHDRFLIIDSTTYHFGASLKDLGKKCFAFSKLDNFDLINKL